MSRTGLNRRSPGAVPRLACVARPAIASPRMPRGRPWSRDRGLSGRPAASTPVFRIERVHTLFQRHGGTRRHSDVSHGGWNGGWAQPPTPANGRWWITRGDPHGQDGATRHRQEAPRAHPSGHPFARCSVPAAARRTVSPRPTRSARSRCSRSVRPRHWVRRRPPGSSAPVGLTGTCGPSPARCTWPAGRRTTGPGSTSCRRCVAWAWRPRCRTRSARRPVKLGGGAGGTPAILEVARVFPAVPGPATTSCSCSGLRRPAGSAAARREVSSPSPVPSPVPSARPTSRHRAPTVTPPTSRCRPGWCRTRPY